MDDPTPVRSASWLPRVGRREHLVVLLAIVSGSVDAIGFLALGGAFTSVMTGNFVISGVAIAHGDGTLLARAASAIVGYVAGCAIGARVAGDPADGSREHWPPAVSRTLILEATLFVVSGALWWAAGSRPGDGMQITLLAINGAALGMQSAAMTRFGVSGLSTTYLTGTLTTLVVRLAHRKPLGEVQLNLHLLLGLIAGAVAGAALALNARGATPLLPLVLLALTIGAAGRLHRPQRQRV